PLAVTATTFDELLTISRVMTLQLKTDAAEVPIGEPSRTAADSLVLEAPKWEPFLRGKGKVALDQVAINQATLWYQAFAQARNDLDTYKRWSARTKLERAAAEAEDAQSAVERIPDELADFQRSAFLRKDDEVLEKLTSVVGKSLQVAAAL